MIVGYFPGWETGIVRDYLELLSRDGQRKKAVGKLLFDIRALAASWPVLQLVTVKVVRGYEPLRELVREYDGIAYRIYFCIKEQEIWLLHAIEKKKGKAPLGELRTSFERMQSVLRGEVRRPADG